jgi:hypothetical protein
MVHGGMHVYVPHGRAHRQRERDVHVSTQPHRWSRQPRCACPPRILPRPQPRPPQRAQRTQTLPCPGRPPATAPCRTISHGLFTVLVKLILFLALSIYVRAIVEYWFNWVLPILPNFASLSRLEYGRERSIYWSIQRRILCLSVLRSPCHGCVSCATAGSRTGSCCLPSRKTKHPPTFFIVSCHPRPHLPLPFPSRRWAFSAAPSCWPCQQRQYFARPCQHRSRRCQLRTREEVTASHAFFFQQVEQINGK